jgi:pimeloyl-ACP methyl ester carboxylesterase
MVCRGVTSPNVRDRRDGGRWLHPAVGKVFIRSGPGRAPTVPLLHGYPSSSFDFRAVLPHLADHAWVTMDFLGFGLSDKPRPHR